LSRKAGDREAGAGSPTARQLHDRARRQRTARRPHHIAYARGRRGYLEPHRIRQIVKTYSDHIALPIVLADGNKEETINSASAL